MKHKDDITWFLKNRLDRLFAKIRNLLSLVWTVTFWKQVFRITFVVMAAVGSYVTLKAIKPIKPIITAMEKPVIGAWKGSQPAKYVVQPKYKNKAKKSNKSKKSVRDSAKKKKQHSYAVNKKRRS